MTADRHSAGIVMLVDDNPDTLKMLIDALEGVGLTALVARDGASALSLLDRIEPDVILLDAVMPHMDGFELCHRIKQYPAFENTPVLFMTGLSDSTDIVAGLNAGAVDYIVKPFNPGEVIARLTNHLANARMIADARQAIDISGAAILAVDEAAQPTWRSATARSAIREIYGDDDAAKILADPGFRGWFAACSTRPVSETSPLNLTGSQDERVLRIKYLGRNASREHLFEIAIMSNLDPVRCLAETFTLSQREAEVLLWLTRGKANRDIADILKISPRTVTKHVEQVLSKLCVENRTAAAVLAMTRCPSDRFRQ